MFLQFVFQFLLMALQWDFLVVLGVFAKGLLVSSSFPVGNGSFEQVVEKNRRGSLY